MKNAMSIRTLTRAACALALVGAAALTLNTFAGDPAAKQDGTAPHLPPGMTEADMKAMMDAATPGPMHAYLAKDSGTWNGANKYWMTPNAPPSESTISSTSTVIMGGRFIQQDCTSEMPGIGTFTGMMTGGKDFLNMEITYTRASEATK